MRVRERGKKNKLKSTSVQRLVTFELQSILQNATLFPRFQIKINLHISLLSIYLGVTLYYRNKGDRLT